MAPLFEAISTLFGGMHLWFMIFGALLGLVIGALPGLGGGMALALLLPLTYSMDPGMAVVLLIAAYGANPLGGSIPAILINTPGSAENASTTLDGFPMAKQGRAGEAIGAAMMSSALGTILGFLVLIALIPVAKQLVLAFSYPEFFMLAVFGLTVIAMVTKGNRARGLIAAGVGLLIAFIGLDPVFGNPRFTFGSLRLEDGISLIPVVIGLMALSEAIKLYSKGSTVAEDSKMKVEGLMEGFKQSFIHWKIVVRSSVIGIIIGAIPGPGSTVAGFMAYGQAAQFSKEPQRFGKGAVEGVIASEASHNAKEGGSFLPTMAFGIPGTSSMAILMGALILHGIAPGPDMLTRNVDIVYLIIVGWLFGGIVTAIGGSIAGKYLVGITKIPSRYIAPGIIILAVVGVYSISQSYMDVVITIIFGLIGYQMRKFGFSRVALVIGLVLGSLAETSFLQTMQAFGWMGFITRPISLVLVLLTVAALLYPLWQKHRNSKNIDQFDVKG